MKLPDPSIVESLRKPTPQYRQRFTALGAAMWLILITLFGRSFYLQIVRGADLRERAENNRIEAVIDPAPRGIIYDRYGQPLVKNVSSTDLIFDPVLLPSVEDEGFLLENLPRLLPELRVEDVRKALQRARDTRQPTVLAKALDHDTVLRLEESRDEIPGARLASALVREYPDGYQLAHALGYTSAVTAEELESQEQLYPTDITGKLGIERMYDDALRGEHGFSYIEVNASGRTQTDLGKQEPIAGTNLQLTIDAEFQKFIFSALAERDKQFQEEHGARLKGAVVALNPQNGEVLAFVSYPSFDPNAFSQPRLQPESAAFFSDESRPLFNRVTDGTYPSGSTIKPFLAAAALEEGVINPQTSILSNGGISVGPWNFPDWKAGGHGLTDVKKAIAESVNTFFYAISGGYEDINGLGLARATDYLEKFGWGAPTGIDLPSEASGFLPSKKWKEEEKGEPWYIGDTYHLGIGQGDVLATPLQVAVATAGVAEGGYIYQPRIVNQETAKHPIGIARQHMQVVQEGMRQTVTDGSGRALSDLPIALAGKTGTAQIGGSEDTHAWFASFGPYEKPEMALTVLLERGGAGDEDAVPVAREIWSWWAEHRLHQDQ